MECPKAERGRSDWAKEVNLNGNYHEHKDIIFHMYSDLKDMWNNHFRRLHTTTHEIDLTKREVRLVKSALYRAALQAYNFDRQEIDKMFGIQGNKGNMAARRKRERPIVLFLKESRA